MCQCLYCPQQCVCVCIREKNLGREGANREITDYIKYISDHNAINLEQKKNRKLYKYM